MYKKQSVSNCLDTGGKMNTGTRRLLWWECSEERRQSGRHSGRHSSQKKGRQALEIA